MTSALATTAPARRAGRESRQTLVRSGSRGREPGRAAQPVATDAPWARRHLVRLAVWMGVGLVGLAISWFKISGEGDWHDQMPWLFVGIVALAISGLGTAGWLMAASRVVHLEAHRVMSQLQLQNFDGVSGPAPVAEHGSAGALVSAPGMTRVHREGCALVAGKNASPVGSDEIETRRLQPCGVCSG